MACSKRICFNLGLVFILSFLPNSSFAVDPALVENYASLIKLASQAEPKLEVIDRFIENAVSLSKSDSEKLNSFFILLLKYPYGADFTGEINDPSDIEQGRCKPFEIQELNEQIRNWYQAKLNRKEASKGFYEPGFFWSLFGGLVTALFHGEEELNCPQGTLLVKEVICKKAMGVATLISKGWVEKDTEFTCKPGYSPEPQEESLFCKYSNNTIVPSFKKDLTDQDFFPLAAKYIVGAWILIQLPKLWASAQCTWHKYHQNWARQKASEMIVELIDKEPHLRAVPYLDKIIFAIVFNETQLIRQFTADENAEVQ